MLTREEAKTKMCVCHLSEFPAMRWVYGTTSSNDNKFEYCRPMMNCKAENCPKWKDEFLQYENLKSHCSNLDCDKCGNIEDYQKHCLKCDKHFGRCAG